MGKQAMGGVVGGAAMAAVMLVSGACDSERPCTLIGAPAGIRVEVRPPEAARVASASLRVCWNGACETPRIELRGTSKSVPLGCDGDGPDAACGASASPDGGMAGFASVAELPKAPVDVELTLRDTAGDEMFRERLSVTPEATHPNGPDCGEGGAQAVLTMADGRVTAG
ncbi:hypothetical protein GCM10010182_22020 [Actinomadura cremea]|nr:hypothetical protein GCM10010182_22020 [Actinomadura cremea]